MNKILLIIIALIIVLGAFTFLGNKNSNQTPTQPSESMSSEKTTGKTAETQSGNQLATITLTDSGFTPKDITVKTGTRVVWINKSGTAATVSSDDHPTHRLYPFLNLGEFADGSSVQVVVEKVGKYSYHNHLNASEVGTITAE